MTSRTQDPMNDDWFDREIRRFLELETRQIDGAPSRVEMHDRLSRTTGLLDATHPVLGNTRALRIVLVLALLAALLGGVMAVGSHLLPTKSLVLAPTPRPSPENVLALGAGDIPAGTHWVVDRTSTPFTLRLPAGWLREADGEIHKGDPWAGTGVSINTWLVTQVYGDACDAAGTLRETPSRQLVVAALGEQKGHTTSAPIEVTLGGLPATRLEITVPSDYDGTGCDNPDLEIWPDSTLDNSLWAFGGETLTIYVVEGAGPTVFTAIQRDATNTTDVGWMQAILASVHFEL